MYQVRILDKNKQLKAALPGVRWYYKREINAVGPVEVYIPKTVIEDHIPVGHSLHDFFHTQSKLIHAEIASFVQVYKGNRLVVSGKITGRTLGQVVTVFASTEEILLESSITPAQYGAVWDGWDLADVARDLLDGWQTLRVKAQEQWQDRIVSSSNVDLTTDPGKVMLAKRSNGRYYEQGYITLLFDRLEVVGFKAWDRVRWSADSDGPEGDVQTTIQYSTNGTTWSDPFDGGLPEEVGLYIGGDHDKVWIRINLITRDTESEDPDGNPRGVTPVVFACELIARTHGDLVVGNIPSVAGETVTGLSANHATALKVLHEACDQVGWEFSVWDGALNVAENIGVDRTKDFVFRTGTNIEIASLGDGDDSLVNILTAQGPGRGINRLEITLRDEASIQEYGPYPNREPVEFNVETLAELTQKAQEYLNEHSTPQMDFAITVLFEHGQEPEYGLGDKVRVADPDTGLITATRVVTEMREYGADGLIVNLELGKPSFKLSEAIGRDGKDGKDGKDGRDGKDGKDGKDGEDFVPPIPADPVWGGYALTNTLRLTWEKAEHASGYEIRTNLNWGSANGMLFTGYAHDHNFIPTEREMILYLRALNAVGEYSVGYDTLNVSLPAPDPPDQPTVEPYFSALKIHPTPLNDPAVMGYYVYVTGDGIDDKLAIIAGGSLTYPLPSGTTVTIQISAYDIIGEGGKSEPLQATTTALDEMDIPDWVKEPIENIEEKIVLDVDEDGNISGIVSVKDGSISNHISILADRFSIATPEGRKQVFAFDTEEHKAYILGDLISEGLIRTPEVQADVAKALLLQAELAVVDEADILRLRADKITVGGTSSFLFSKPEGSTLWHFDNSLVSNSGIKPLDGSVATLRPDEGRFGGAVAVEEGTTNLFANPTLSSEAKQWVRSNSTVKNYDGYVRITASDTYAGVYQTVEMQEGVTYTLSYWYRYVSGAAVVGSHIDGWNERNIQIRIDKGPWIVGNVIDVPDDNQFHFIEVRHTSTSSGSKKVYLQPGRGQSEATTGDIRTGYGFGVQLEAKPFATSFVDGTRLDGILAYPIALPEDYSIACWRKSPTDTNYRHVVKRSDGKVFVDGVEDSEYDVGWIGYDGDVLMLSNQTGLIDELMAIPYLATGEEAQSWASMRVPFYDPLTHIDAGTIPISAGEVEITGKGIKLIENDIVKAALGDLEGLPWGGSLLPAGEHGLYAKDAYLIGALQVQHEGQPILVVDKDDDGGKISFYDASGNEALKITADLEGVFYNPEDEIIKGAKISIGEYISDSYSYPLIEIYAGVKEGVQSVANRIRLVAPFSITNHTHAWTNLVAGGISVAESYPDYSGGKFRIWQGVGITPDGIKIIGEEGTVISLNTGRAAYFSRDVYFLENVNFREEKVHGLPPVPVITGTYTGNGDSNRIITLSGLGNRKIRQLLLHSEDSSEYNAYLVFSGRNAVMFYTHNVDYWEEIYVTSVIKITSDGKSFQITSREMNSSGKKYYYTAFVY